MPLNDRSAALIEKLGIVFLVIGIAVIACVYERFESLPNYLRIATAVPLAFAFPMMTVEAYRSRWHLLGPVQKARATFGLFVPFLLVGGCVIWYLVDPTAKG